MIQQVPQFINVLFILTTLLTIFLFYRATNKSGVFLLIVLLWIALQAILGLTGFYTVTDGMPPRFLLLLSLPLLSIAVLFILPKGRVFIDGLDLKSLTILHVVRIPVELVLFWLFLHKAVPELMTFEGRNFDILSGLTAPLVYYALIRNKLSRKILLVWNFICLGLLINIVANAILSAPFMFQKFAFDQPNIAVLYFPFVWLPCCVVPLVLLSHLAAIRQLVSKQN